MKTPFLRLLPLLCLFTASIQAQTPASKPDAASAKLSAQKAQQMTARVLRETSELRGLPIKRAVKSGVKTRGEVEAMLRNRMQNELPANQLLASELLVRQLGLAPADFGLKSSYIAMMGEQIGGYYSSKTKEFVTTDRIDALQLETVMAHELTHALQDQHFDLSRLENWPEHDSDRRLAMSALVEGDATLLMSRYMAQSPLRFLGVLASSLKSGATPQSFNRAPRILREGITFPYIQGTDFVTKLHRRGGWKAVSAAFGQLPQSTEQILHFEKYLALEAPVWVPVRDLSARLGKTWKLLDHDVNGELGLFLTLAEHLGDDEAAKAAAAGWAGDRYSVYQGAKKGVLVVQECRFDSQFDARQFREAYARAASKRFGIGARKRGNLQVWNAAPNGIWMEQSGKRVLILEGTVGAFNPAPVLAALKL